MKRGLVLAALMLALTGCGGAPAASPVRHVTRTATVTELPTINVTATKTVHPTVTRVVRTTLPPPPPRRIMRRDGTYVVGMDVRPGTYRAAQAGARCYWARLASFGNSDIIANGVGPGQQVVTITATDKAFETSSCGVWTTLR